MSPSAFVREIGIDLALSYSQGSSWATLAFRAADFAVVKLDSLQMRNREAGPSCLDLMMVQLGRNSSFDFSFAFPSWPFVFLIFFSSLAMKKKQEKGLISGVPILWHADTCMHENRVRGRWKRSPWSAEGFEVTSDFPWELFCPMANCQQGLQI